MTKELISDRLLLRPLQSDEVIALHRLWTEEGVRRFLWDDKVIPIEQTQEIVEKSLRLFASLGFGIWGIHELNSTQLVGFSGYWHFRTPPSLELLFGISSDHWNRGMATEASNCVIRYGFEMLHFRTIVASTDAANTASQRVLEKLGMTVERRASTDSLDTVFYGLTLDHWQESAARESSRLSLSGRK